MAGVDMYMENASNDRSLEWIKGEEVLKAAIQKSL
jgi:hypothetical protein